MRFLCAVLLFFTLLGTSFTARAIVRTGSFDLTIKFMDTTRELSCYIPTSYNDSNKYRLMVCLHGLGDNSANYRNALIFSLQWQKYFPNTIFICPEASATTADFISLPGDESIVDSCMEFAMSNYHIDTSDVILQGFSLGGRAALRYGLEHYAKFKALLLNTPAIQGVKNALNGQPSYTYIYQNASHIPIYITHGETDIAYEPPIDTALKMIIQNDGVVRYDDVPKIGHTIPTFNQMSDALEFIDTPARAGNDVDLFELDVPARIFSSTLNSKVLVQNVGSDTVTSIVFAIAQGTFTVPYTWKGSLAPFQHAVVDLPGQVVESGAATQTIDVRIDSIDGVLNTMTSDNEKIDTFQYITQGASLPMAEGFEEANFPPPGWLLQLAGDFFSPWFQDTVRKSGNYSAGAFNSLFFFDNEGRAEGLVSPVLNLTTAPSPQLSFDLAYNYDRYTPPYFTGTVNLTDTLDVLISTDGGATFTSLLRKSGADLATFADPIVNPLSADAIFILPQDTNWRHYTIDLSNYASAPEAFIKFNYISGLGGSIYIDNVSVASPAGVMVPKPITYSIYPNPATDKVTIAGSPDSPANISLLDVAGREVLSEQGQTNASGEFSIDTHTLLSGLYFARVSIGDHASMVKLTIER